MTNFDRTILAKTRAEEHEADVWGKFFIPPYFDSLGLHTSTKSTYIVGKRGCGKTMLLKYLDYHTAFSSTRENIPHSEINHVGIYWRVDTQFCNSMQYRGIEETEWIVSFENYFSLIIATEIVKSLKVIAQSAYKGFSKDDLEQLRLPSLPDFDSSFSDSPEKLESQLEKLRRQFGMWISNVHSAHKPLLPPGRMFLDSLIADIRTNRHLSDISFSIYVDEVENLASYQRRVLNTFLKHSQRPLIVNFTSKVQSGENMTTGPEWINATHDYRLIELEALLPERERSVFFAEVVIGNLYLAADEPNSTCLENMLAPEGLQHRQKSEYQDSVLKEIRARFPSLPIKQIAAEALSNPKLLAKLTERIVAALKRRYSKTEPANYLRYLEIAPEAVILLPALLNRETQEPEFILGELDKFAANGEGAFKTSWIHNNIFGAVLELYRPYGRTCPIYSGFDTFFTMANGNLRHFIILCYKAVEVAELVGEDSDDYFSVETQARAAFDSAEQLLHEIWPVPELKDTTLS